MSRRTFLCGHFSIALMLFVASWNSAVAEDWPQWNGPTRDGVVTEADIITQIPSDGLKRLWSESVSLGYSGPAVADGRVFVTDYQKASGRIANNPGSRDKLTGRERVNCFDAASGKKLWDDEYERPYAVSYGSGPRATPTVHDGLVFTLGAEGNLNCYQADTGKIVWQKDFAKDFGASTPLWGHSAAPLIYHDTLICLVGGVGSLVVAFDYRTGVEKWRSLSADETGYCPPSIITAGGVEQLLIWEPTSLHSLNPDNGKEYWQHALKPGYGMSILPPVRDGDLLFASGESNASLMLKLSKDKPAAEELWRGNPRNSVYLATAAAVFDNGYLYGSDTRSGALVCAQASDGQRMWQTTQPTSGGEGTRGKAHGSAFLLKTNDGYLILSDTGDFISATLTPEGYTETGRFHAIDPTEQMGGRTLVWSFPAISNGRLYLRNGDSIVCYSLKRE